MIIQPHPSRVLKVEESLSPLHMESGGSFSENRKSLLGEVENMIEQTINIL